MTAKARVIKQNLKAKKKASNGMGLHAFIGLPYILRGDHAAS